MKVLVTGASGFIGTQVTKRLCTKGFEVHAVARTRVDIAGAKWHQVDLLDVNAAEKLMSQIRPTHIIHLAWCTEPGKFWNSSDNEDWESATRVLFDSFVSFGGKRFVGAGTCAEYEWNEQPCLETNLKGTPSTLYGRTKLSTWRYIDSQSRQRGVSSAWGRIFWLYGPSEHRARLIPHVINGIMRGIEVNCTNGEQVRDFTHVFDVAEAFVRLLESEVDGPVNIASGTPVHVRQIIAQIAKAMQGEHLVKLGALATKASEPHSVIASVDLLNSTVGFKPTITLDSGLLDTISWWKTENSMVSAAK